MDLHADAPRRGAGTVWHGHTWRWRRATVGLVIGLTAVATACTSQGSSAAPGTYTVWDPYPQFTNGSAWVRLLDRCGTDSGVTVRRTAFDTTDLTGKVLLAAQQGGAPDVLIVDNPVVSTLAEAGILTDTGTTKADTSSVEANLLAAGQSDGRTYGIPIGANTLALYYNKDILHAAGVDPASVRDWASLTAALAKVKATGKKGIAFSAIGTEEGSFQFLPWFWGAGANLTDLASPRAVDALTLWTGWLHDGYAPNSVINDTQTTSWQEFATGQFAFAENGTWQLDNARKAGFPFGVLPIPGMNGGTAPAPTGGEFVTVPTRSDTARYATDRKLVACLTKADNAYTTDTTLTYVGATSTVQDKQVTASPDLATWVTAVRAARGRTSDNLGTKYPKISEQLWTAVQAALSGSASPRNALTAAKKAADAATG
jgi:multiple sugar transport system substrate-binding protein